MSLSLLPDFPFFGLLEGTVGLVLSPVFFLRVAVEGPVAGDFCGEVGGLVAVVVPA